MRVPCVPGNSLPPQVPPTPLKSRPVEQDGEEASTLLAATPGTAEPALADSPPGQKNDNNGSS